MAISKNLNSVTRSEPSEFVPEAQYKKPKRRWGKIFNLILILALIGLGYGYYEKEKQLKLVTDPTVQAEAVKQATADTVTKVGKIVLLPSNEEPQVLVINDVANAVKQQPALEGVVVGDQILVYSKNSKAIVYSPSRNIIVNILPVVSEPNTPSPVTTTATSTKK